MVKKRGSVKKVSKPSTKYKVTSFTSGNSNKTPKLVKAVAILFYVGCAFAIIIGSLLLLGTLLGSGVLGALDLQEVLKEYPNVTQTDLIIANVLLKFLGIGSLVLIAIGILDFFIARGLWNRQPWARIVAIVLMAIGFLISLMSFDLIGVIISGLIGGYLIFSKEVKRAFN